MRIVRHLGKEVQTICVRCRVIHERSGTVLPNDAPWWHRWLLPHRKTESGSINICMCGEISVALDNGQLRPATSQEIEQLKKSDYWPEIRHLLFEFQKRGEQ